MTAVAITCAVLALSGWAGGPALRLLLSRSRADPAAAALTWGACALAWVSTCVITAVAAAGWSTGGWELAGPLRHALSAWRLTYGQGFTVDVPPAAGLLTAVALTARLAWAVASTTRGRRRARHSLHLWLAQHGVRTALPGGRSAVVVQDPECLAVCLPGRAGLVVLSSATVALLPTDALAAVLAHEQAHQRGHHHLATAVSGTLHRAFPGVRLLADADAGLKLACERIADESAAARWGPRVVAGALVAMASGGPRPDAGVLGAATHEVYARVEALLAPSASHRRAGATAGVVAAGITVAPWAVLAVPAVRAAIDLL